MVDDIKVELIKKHINSYPDFPKKGVLFRDVFSVLQNPSAFQALRDVLIQVVKEIQPPIECVVALDARGFLLGPLISLELNIPLVPIRKQGKLPGKVNSVTYTKEYGKDTLEIQAEAIEKGKRVLIVDDLLATGGSLSAACELVSLNGGKVGACLVIIELVDLKGRNNGIPSDVISIIKY